MKTHRTAHRAVLGVLLLLSLAATPAHALRCSHRLISEGDHAEKLLKYCGEPIAVQSRYAERPYWHRRGGGETLLTGFYEEVIVEEWTYNFGPRRLMRVVRLENGIVRDIKQLGYGFRTP